MDPRVRLPMGGILVVLVAMALVAGCLASSDAPASQQQASDGDAVQPQPSEQSSEEGQQPEYATETFATEASTSLLACGGAAGRGYCVSLTPAEGSSFEPDLPPAKQVSFTVAWDEPGVELTAEVLVEGEDRRVESFTGPSPLEGTVPMDDAGFSIHVSASRWVGDPSLVGAAAGVPIAFELTGEALVLAR